MNRLEKALALVAPVAALRRAAARRALQTMAYDAASTSGRGVPVRVGREDADSAAAYGRRARMAAVARDLMRNSPWATRARQVIVASAIGDGIIPKLVSPDADLRADGLALIKAHCDTTAIDAQGRQNLYGLQALAFSTMVESGEALIVRRLPSLRDGLALPVQIEVLEPDFLDNLRDGSYPDGRVVLEGIEYDASGRRLGYWIYDQHPGALHVKGSTWSFESRFVPARDVVHLYRQDRPGQQRGVSWFAPVAVQINDLLDYQHAQLVRQKVAATFAAFWRRGENAGAADAMPVPSELRPGAVYQMQADEDVTFPTLPPAGDFEPFVAAVLRSVATAMGITYESLTGDLSRVNYSSARMGRAEMERNVSAWQWTLVVPVLLDPVARWLREAWITARPERARDIVAARVEWVPPHRFLVDPAREVPAIITKIRGGLTSRQRALRELGFDPEDILREQVEDRAKADAAQLVFDSDPRSTSAAGVAQPATEPTDSEDQGNDG